MSAPATVLILRTVSVEKLDGVLAACREQWPEAKLTVLTSPGRRAELAADARVTEVLAVDLGPNGFDGNLRVGRPFDAVVVPLGNRRGAGYANVLQAARQVPAARHFLAGYARELQPISRARLGWRVLAESLFLAMSLPMAWLRARLHRW